MYSLFRLFHALFDARIASLRGPGSLARSLCRLRSRRRFQATASHRALLPLLRHLGEHQTCAASRRSNWTPQYMHVPTPKRPILIESGRPPLPFVNIAEVTSRRGGTLQALASPCGAAAPPRCLHSSLVRTPTPVAGSNDTPRFRTIESS